MIVDALPSGVSLYLASFLTGFDLFRLSHVNQRLLTELLAPDSDFWLQRLPVDDPTNGACSAKKRYMISTTSLLFPGYCPDNQVTRRGAAVDLAFPIKELWMSSAFSFDLWFAMLPRTSSEPEMYLGGVIFGAQTAGFVGTTWPSAVQTQFVNVDPLGNLYCSVIVNDRPIVAANLELERWYHVALTLQRSEDRDDSTRGLQCVYLDGELIHTSEGTTPQEIWGLRGFQIGSGSMFRGSKGIPDPDFVGWYCFHGAVDECRFWRGVLDQNQIRKLIAGREKEVCETIPCEYSIKQVTEFACERNITVKRVRCTRPQERRCLEIIPLHPTQI